MKILINLIIFVVIVAGIVAVIPAFIDPVATVSREIDVNKPVEVVFDVVKNYDLYRKWNSWSRMDKNARNEISGTPGEVGSRWSWHGDTVGRGSLTLESLVPNKSITGHLEFYTPFKMVAQDLWQFEAKDSNTTHIKWSYKTHVSSYLMRYMNLGIDGMLGPELAKSLQNLKQFLEKMPASQRLEKEVEVITY